MEKLSQQILQKIKQDNITPRAAWTFRLLSLLWLLLTLAAVVFGAVAIGLAAFVWENQSWELLSLPASGRLQTMLLAMPYSWLAVLVALAWLSYYYFRHIGCGYRQPIVKVLAVVLGLNLLGGYLLLSSGWSQRLHDFLVRNSSAYERHFDSRNVVWSRPEAGFLSGRIVAVELPVFYLDDFRKHHWRILTSADTIIDSEVQLVHGQKIKVLGRPRGYSDFSASQIKVWTCGCGGHCDKCKGQCEITKEKTCH